MKKLTSEQVIYEFKEQMKPVMTISPGSTVTVETNDCFFQQVENEETTFDTLDFDRINPATGPIEIEDAKPGDLLKITIDDIRIADKGVSGVLKDGGALGDLVEKNTTKVIPVTDGKVQYAGKEIPIDPMIGVIGVSPGSGEKAWPTDTPYKHGGNMDTTDIRKGNILYFQVREEGALLALGDVHGIMGDAELCFTGLEIPAEVDLTVDLIKDKKTEWPLIESDKAYMVVASGETLNDALRNAAKQAVSMIQKGLGLTFEEAYIFNSLFVDYKISQVVNPMQTVRAAIRKDAFSKEEFKKALS